MLDASGRPRDLSGLLPDITPRTLSPEGLAALRAVHPEALPLLPAGLRPGLPWRGCRKFLCVGLNYADHAAEAGMALPTEPILFTKQLSSLVGAQDTVVLPQGATKGDWEVELGVVIGRTARCIAPDEALAHVAGYCVVNDVSERSFQLERGGTWDKGKGCDTFGPVGPWLVTADEVPDPQALSLWLEVDGQRRQNGSTATMVYGVAFLVSYLSRFMSLQPGDIISTGTPPGVGMGHKPPIYLQPGQTMRLGVEGLGVQTQAVVAAG